MTQPDQIPEQEQGPAPGDTEFPTELQPGEVRSQLMADVAVAKDQPDLAAQVYQKLGIENNNVATTGVRAKMQDLKPGDLVGWVGGQEPDGRYVGNIAVWAGGGEIIENVFGHNRRRKLGPTENTFGIPVNLDPMGVGDTENAPTAVVE